ncbi:LOW QUALITY PROTEIN: hypothetical protein QYF61_003471 [Mycteria americana]|uniref:Uncharacterized protein n=1 Tax=Mycteria americana TaxID=33587 RepID=A0AAN7PGS0_MYCAM|nr:LOW QUALITY PROTEIN: hypothetical protein QYF61_003471 [Mycteria americana]
MVGLLGCERTLQAHVQLFIHQYPRVLLRRAAPNPFIPQPILIPGIAPTQVHDLALGLVEPHQVHMGPLLELVQVPLDGIPVSTGPLSLVSSANLLRVHLIPLSMSLMKILNNIEPLTTTLWMRPSSQFLIHRTVHSSNPYLSNLERRMLITESQNHAKQPQLPQPLLIRLVLQTLHQLRCPSLDTLQHLNVSLVVRGPKLNTVFEVQPHQCQVQGDNHFPSPAGHGISDTSQDAIGLLGHLVTLLACIQSAVNQHPQVLFHQAAFQPLFPKPVALHGLVVVQVQDLALGLVEPHTIGLGPWIQPVQVPLQSLPALKSTLPPNLVSSANLLRVHSIPSSRSLIKILNRTGPSTEPWGTLLVTSWQVDLTPFTFCSGLP